MDTKLSIDELGYVEEMRQRIGVEPDNDGCDKEILDMSPMERVRLIAAWKLGSESWADYFKDYFESQGLYLTTNPDADGVIHDA